MKLITLDILEFFYNKIITLWGGISSIFHIKNSIKYSSDEQPCGEYINGETIYKLTLTQTDVDLGDPIDTDNLVTKDPTTGKPVNTFSKKWVHLTLPEGISVKQFISVSGFAECYSEKATTTSLWQPIPRICPDACIDYSIGFGDLKSDRISILFGGKYTKVSLFLDVEYLKN